jgi:hypothetical protein
MLVVAKKDGGVLRDSATATEIILQTEKLVDKRDGGNDMNRAMRILVNAVMLALAPLAMAQTGTTTTTNTTTANAGQRRSATTWRRASPTSPAARRTRAPS